MKEAPWGAYPTQGASKNEVRKMVPQAEQTAKPKAIAL